MGVGANMPSQVPLRSLQLAELDVLKYTIQKLDENHIRWYLGYGTLLGAIRHKGFIPWDDDVDIFIPRPDYDRLMQIGPHVFEKPYEFYNPVLMPTRQLSFYVARVGNAEMQCFITYKGKQADRGVWVDLIVVDGISSNRLARAWTVARLRILRHLVRVARSSYEGINVNSQHSVIEKMGIWVNNVTGLGKHLSIHKILRRFDKVLKSTSYDKAKLVYTYAYDYAGSRTTYHKNWFGGGRTASFEGIDMNIPAESEAVLRQTYGDYMRLPPESERIGKHNAENMRLARRGKEK